MWKVFGLFVLLGISLMATADAQSGSRDIMDEYCRENWQRDPVQCAEYVPEDYDEKQAEYAALEAEKARQEAQQIIKEKQNAERVCPTGSHVTNDNQGNPICVDSDGRFTGYPNTGESAIGGDDTIWIGVGILVIIVIAGIAMASKKKGTPQNAIDAPITRRGWTENEKTEVRNRQRGLCNICHNPPPRWEYDHIDGDRSNNSLNNCQGLCPNCHSVKTHEES